ncbi:MAG: hypothetical protein V1679_00265, partial [Candidatus Peregrinibacteria bacterium]
MTKKHLFLGLFLILALTLTSCQIGPWKIDITKTPTDETPAAPPTENGSVAPHFQTDKITYKTPVKIDNDTILGNKKQFILDMYKEPMGEYGNNMTWDNDVDYLFNFYEFGTINVAPYKDWSIVLLDLACDGMCMNTNKYRLAWNKNETDEYATKLVLLDRHSTEYYEPNYLTNAYDTLKTTLYIPELELPDEIKVPDSDYVLTKSERDAYHYTAEGEEDMVAFTDSQIRDVLLSSDESGMGCAFVKKPDGSYDAYSYDPGFLNGESITAQWKDGSAKTNIGENYSLNHRGCGIMNACYYTEEVKNED